jgi:hypothetical protein
VGDVLRARGRGECDPSAWVDGRYLAEFDFRYNNRIALGVDDVERATKALQGISGKRLTYKGPHGQAPN